jgi:hypothetical protein
MCVNFHILIPKTVWFASQQKVQIRTFTALLGWIRTWFVIVPRAGRLVATGPTFLGAKFSLFSRLTPWFSWSWSLGWNELPNTYDILVTEGKWPHKQLIYLVRKLEFWVVCEAQFLPMARLMSPNDNARLQMVEILEVIVHQECF